MSIRGKLYNKKLMEQIYAPTLTFQIIGAIFMVMIFFGVVLISSFLLRLEQPYPSYIGVASMLALLFGICFIASYYGENGGKIVRSFEHPLFGEINQRRVCWDAILSMEEIGEDVFVNSCGGPDVTENQTMSFLWVRDNIGWIKENITNALEKFERKPSSTNDVIYTAFSLDDSKPRTLTIRLEIKNPNDPDCPWKYSAEFLNGNFTELGEESFA